VTPGEILPGDDTVVINRDRPVVSMQVDNTGDRPVQVGSHYHFAEANPALAFDRDLALGRHLDIPAGTSVRFEPGIALTVSLVPYGGARHVAGFRGEVRGVVDA